MNGNPFDRPIILLAAPRSGSTLLFETLQPSSQLWSIGGESHQIFEQFPGFDPTHGACHSNRLTSADADAEKIGIIRRAFYKYLRDSRGTPLDALPQHNQAPIRLLEKTPKNALRVGFLDKVFPDALYIYLYRDPRENLSSMMEAWRSDRFVTYRHLPHWPGKWSLLLPPGYEKLRATSLARVVAAQWQAAHEFIIGDLELIDSRRWSLVSYQDLVSDTKKTVERLCRFADIPFDPDLQARSMNQLPASSYTLTMPERNKWRKNEAAVNSVLHELEPLIGRMENLASNFGSSEVLTSGPIAAGSDAANDINPSRSPGLRRNDPCYCGTGLRFKHCHGALDVRESRAREVQAHEA